MGFKRLEADDFVVSAQAQTATCWSNNVPALTTFFTQSSQTNSTTGEYYTTVFNTDGTDASQPAVAQFEIAYGNETGGGALAYNETANPGVSPASTSIIAIPGVIVNASFTGYA